MNEKTLNKNLTDQLHKNRFIVKEIKLHHKFKQKDRYNYISDLYNSDSIYAVETYSSELWTLDVDVDDLKRVLEVLSVIEEENKLIERHPSVRKAFEQYKITLGLVKGNYYD